MVTSLREVEAREADLLALADQADGVLGVHALQEILADLAIEHLVDMLVGRFMVILPVFF